MKRASRKRCTNQKPTADEILEHVDYLVDEHHRAWHTELTSAAPHWTGLLALHLRLAELEHLDDAVKELL